MNDMERRLGIMQSVEPVLENAIKTLQKVVDIRGMGHTSKPASLVQLFADPPKPAPAAAAKPAEAAATGDKGAAAGAKAAAKNDDPTSTEDPGLAKANAEAKAKAEDPQEMAKAAEREAHVQESKKIMEAAAKREEKAFQDYLDNRIGHPIYL